MKQVQLFMLLMILSASCSNSNDTYKQTILNYLQVDNRLKADLGVTFSRFDMLPDITVADSIRILEEQYQSEKRRTIESVQRNIAHLENAIEEQKNNDGEATKASVSGLPEQLKVLIIELEKAEQWKPGYLNRYNGYSPTDILAKKVDVRFSFQSSKTIDREEIDAIFTLSPDGKKCYKIETTIINENFPYQMGLPS